MQKVLSIFFLFCAVMAGLLGFGVMVGESMLIAKMACGVFFSLFLATLLYDPKRRCSEI